MKKIICLLIIMAAIASCTSKTETKVAGNSDTEAVERVIMSRRSACDYVKAQRASVHRQAD